MSMRNAFAQTLTSLAEQVSSGRQTLLATSYADYERLAQPRVDGAGYPGRHRAPSHTR